MRTIQSVIAEIIPLLPADPTSDIADNMTVLKAELAVMNRAANYTPPESELVSSQWARLEATLYRYMPPVTYAPWCVQISALVMNTAAGAKK
jgi:hypothetical protein